MVTATKSNDRAAGRDGGGCAGKGGWDEKERLEQ